MNDSNKKPKARLTAKGNVKVTLTNREARLITALLGATTGDFGYELNQQLEDLVGVQDVFPVLIPLCRCNTDEVPE